MKKVWTVTLKRSYQNHSNSRQYCVIADNAKDAINKAVNVHKRIAKKNFDYLDYKCAVEIELSNVTDSQ